MTEGMKAGGIGAGSQTGQLIRVIGCVRTSEQRIYLLRLNRPWGYCYNHHLHHPARVNPGPQKHLTMCNSLLESSATYLSMFRPEEFFAGKREEELTGSYVRTMMIMGS
jgi:hypothetical protein